jgi:hypothetical protein
MADETRDPAAFAQARLDEEEDHYRRRIVVINAPRALRDVEAGRRILARHAACSSGAGYDDMWTGPDPCPDMADLLYRWADHLDYDQKWKPHG